MGGGGWAQGRLQRNFPRAHILYGQVKEVAQHEVRHPPQPRNGLRTQTVQLTSVGMCLSGSVSGLCFICLEHICSAGDDAMQMPGLALRLMIDNWPLSAMQQQQDRMWQPGQHLVQVDLQRAGLAGDEVHEQLP